MYKRDLATIASVHPERGMHDLSHSGVAWGTLIDPGLALLAVPPADKSGPLRMLAGPPEPSAGMLLDAPVARILHLRAPRGRSYLVAQADLTDWTAVPGEPWSPTEDDPFSDDAAALADEILNRCTAPDENWFARTGQARAELAGPPHPYPDLFPSPTRAPGARWFRVLTAYRKRR